MKKALAAGLVVATACAGGAGAQQVCDAPAAGKSSPTARFVDNADGTVTDKESKLMWLHCSAGQAWESGRCRGDVDRLNWAAAQSLASDVNRRGTFFFNDWRLPQLRELATLTERRCANPRVNLAVFPDTPAEPYWSSTPRPGAGNESFAFALDFGAEGVVYRPKEEANHVRLVRSAQ